jgi:Na+/proline symporter
MEYLEQRYNLSVRQTITWFGLIMRFLDNTVRLYAIGVFITVVTPVSLEWSIVISGIIVTIFNVIGGVWSVVVMSTVQFVILILAVMILFPLSLMEVGGFKELYARLPEHLNCFNGPKGNLVWLVVFYFMIIVKYNENWTFIQKFYCVRDEKAAMKVGVVTGIMFFVFTPIFLLPAVASKLIVPDLADPEMAYVVVSKILLPAGIMGILFSSMFAATMSSLNAEYNIMSGVLTNDVYKRLINRKATEKQLLWVARITTGLVGVLIIIGGLFIRHFGGAFEANKLFTGILAIPLGFPLLFGVVFKRPNASASVLTILIGAISGVILNAIPSISWEMATFIETCICAVVYFVPGYFMKSSDSQTQKVDVFFQKMNTPILEEDKPNTTFEYKRMLSFLFIFSFLISGGLFAGMSIPSLHLFSGKLSMLAGMVCIVGAIVLWVYYKRVIEKTK